MKYPSISIIISTRNSEKIINSSLASIAKQNYPRTKYEVIVVDNNSTDQTCKVAKKIDARVFQVQGIPPQVCKQRNLGVQKAKFEYVYILDHDMELSDGFLLKFAEQVAQTKNSVDAWYVPETIIASNDFLSRVRTFENSYYDKTWIGAARIIRKSIFNKTADKYDDRLSGGPADWDMDIQLRKLGCIFGTMEKGIFHHEEKLSFWKYITKKGVYVKGGELYKEKWKTRDEEMYQQIMHKQYGPYYRLIGIFLENGKWKSTIVNFPLYLGFILIKSLMAVVYFVNIKKS